MTFEDDLPSWRTLASERLGDWKAERERRIQAEKERDSWESIAQQTARSIDALRAEQPRTLTADNITDEMAERAREEFFGGDIGGPVSGPSSARRWRAALTAALTPPPKRPEGAEEIQALIDEWNTDDAGDFADLADHLAARLTDPTRKEA